MRVSECVCVIMRKGSEKLLRNNKTQNPYMATSRPESVFGKARGNSRRGCDHCSLNADNNRHITSPQDRNGSSTSIYAVLLLIYTVLLLPCQNKLPYCERIHSIIYIRENPSAKSLLVCPNIKLNHVKTYNSINRTVSVS